VKEHQKPMQSFAPAGGPVTPYQKAAAEWDRRIGAAVVQAKNWRLACLLTLLLAGFLTGATTFFALRSSIVPYIVEVGANGEARVVDRAGQYAYNPRGPQVKYYLSQFVLKTRSVSIDPVVTKNNWLSAYEFLTKSASVQMAEYIKKDDPMKSIGKEMVSVTINSIVNATKDTYQIRWKEERFSKEGGLVGTSYMTGLYTLVFQPPKKESQLLSNPLGIYIKNFSFNKDVNQVR